MVDVSFGILSVVVSGQYKVNVFINQDFESF